MPVVRPPGTVAELLLGHAEARSTGVLTLSRGQVRKQLFLRDGVLVSAESNLREEALGELLVTLGLLPRPRLNQLLAEVKRRGQKHGHGAASSSAGSAPDDVHGRPARAGAPAGRELPALARDRGARSSPAPTSWAP